MKIVYLNDDTTVREILPEEINEQGTAFWYGEEFASHCVEAPAEVQPGWVYDPETGTWSEPAPYEPEPVPEPETEPSVWDELDAAYTAGYNEGYQEGVNTAYDQ